MNSKEAANFLGYAEITLRKARVSGVLAGVDAPPFIKMGKRVEYDAEDLTLWKAQFIKITNTAQRPVIHQPGR